MIIRHFTQDSAQRLHGTKINAAMNYQSLAGILIILIISISPFPSHAKTKVYIQNNTPFEFGLKFRQLESPLRREYWSESASIILPGQRVQILWFNRDEGITSSRYFSFEVDVTHPGADVVTLRQRLRGSTVNSHLWQAIRTPGLTHPWFDDRRWHHADWRIPRNVVKIKYRSFVDVTDDNIEYVFYSSPKFPDSQKPTTINILSYNVYMRPTNIFVNGQSKRADILRSKLKGFDVIVFQELFDDDIRSDLLRGISSHYPYHTSIVGEDRGVEQDGGVVLVSKWRIVDEDQITFGEACADDDCKSDKGAIYAKIEKDGLLFHVFGTHLQAGQASEKYDARLRQINLLKDFISSKSISQTEAVFIAGDLNEQMARASRFNNMLTLLDAEMPITSGMPYSSDPVLNDLNDGDERSYLDYVLYSNRHSVPLYGENQILLLRADTSWNLTLSGAHWDLSDHFPALGHFEVGSQ